MSQLKGQGLPEIKHSGFAYDMAGWCLEKSENLVWDLARLAELVKDPERDESSRAEEPLNTVFSLCFDATKLFAFGAGSEWEFQDAELIFEEGKHGYASLCQKYGISPSHQVSPDATEILERLRISIEPLLDGPRSGRTAIHEALRAARMRLSERDSPAAWKLFLRLDDATEQLAIGEVDWPSYRTQTLKILAQFPSAIEVMR